MLICTHSTDNQGLALEAIYPNFLGENAPFYGVDVGFGYLSDRIGQDSPADR
jgi:histidine ammonia-lyase